MKPRRRKTKDGPRLPFASGLPGRDLRDAGPPAAGLAVIGRIRELALSESEALAPRTRRRTDGAEYIDPDQCAVAARQTYDAILALVDGIRADKVLQLRIAAMLARHAERSS